MFYKVYICKPLERASNFETNLNTLQKFEVSNGKRKLVQSKPQGYTKRIDEKGQSLPDTIRPHLNTSNNLYDIGLSELVSNFVYDMSIDDVIRQYNLDAKQWRDPLHKIVSLKEIPKQTWGEIRFGLNYDELTQRRPPKPNKDNPDPRTRIMKTKVVLYDEPNPFSEDNLEGWLKIHILKSRKDRIATDERSANTALQRWLLIEQAVEHKQSIDISNLQNQSIARLFNIEQKYPVTNALEKNVQYFIGTLCITPEGMKSLLKGAVNPATISEKLNNFVKPTDKKLIRYNCETFNSIVELFEKDTEAFYAKALAMQAKNTNTLQHNNGKWYWVSQSKKLDNLSTYEFSSFDAFVTFVQSEMIKMESPILKELIDEVESRNGVIPEVLTMDIPDKAKSKNSKNK